MYLRGSTGYPYKRRKVHPANRPARPQEDVLKIRIPECSCQTIPCSNIPHQLEKNPSFAALTRRRHGRRLVQARHTVRLPRVLFIGVEEADYEREVRNKSMQRPYPDVDMEEADEEEEKEKVQELVLSKDPISQYYVYEALPDPNLVTESAEPKQIPKLTFDPADLGSFPPKASDLMLFSEVKRMRVDQVTLDDLEDEDLEQPERENPPDVMLLPDPVRPAHHLRLKYFDNPTLELRHPSVDLKEVTLKYAPLVPTPLVH